VIVLIRGIVIILPIIAVDGIEEKMFAINKRNKSNFTTIAESNRKTTNGLTDASFPSLLLDTTHTDVGLCIFKLNCYGSFM